jgi:mannose/fructose/N-acetylgalactosamine-specific phosphotransferase system component IIC
MAKLTSGFGVLLTMVAIMGYLWTGGTRPIGMGIALIVCGVLADSESRRRRMIWMHIAVTIGLLGFVIPGVMSVRNIMWARRAGGAIEFPKVQHFQEVMSVLCLLFVAICVGSFIAARRAPKVEAPVGA